ncbi:MAG: ATP synthase F1 subunit delta [Dehalococcoidia bacterium]|nr:ATP synthase F1 subunit delta [Dehalococcoidia bacterium]
MPASGSGKRYAQAIFQISLENNTMDSWMSDLKSLEQAAADPAFAVIMDSPRIPFSDKERVARRRLEGIQPQALNLALLIISKGKVELTHNLTVEYERLLNAHRGIEHATVTTAVPLSKEEEEAIAGRLGQITGKTIILETKVDSSITGGMVARVGDKIIDGSTKAKLQAMKRSLAGV